ncbi:DNA import protein CedB [Acidianus manzaensis]|uniref:AAA family ATPase n=1 Tax=Acidianus manzaensis TaxID=282676 RepID=A0A1W6K3N7_9CREN|nr:DNA import protein CedB [Acidianus manzaensis]ARM77126.1 AAA family ATPase [Acidianus manzaensis]
MEDKDNYAAIFMVVLTIILAVIFRNLLFLLLLLPIGFVLYRNKFIDINQIQKIIKFLNTKNSTQAIKIEDGYIEKSNEFIAVLLVYDIPVDYRDLSEEGLKTSITSFYKILQIGSQIDILFKKKYVNVNNYRDMLLNRSQNLRVVIDSDPSNARAKRELEIINFLLDRLSEGEYPFKYEIYLFIHGDNKDKVIQSAEVISRGLEGLNIKSRLANRKEIENAIFFNPSKANKVTIPSQVPFLTPFSIDKLPSLEIRSDGILLGKDMIHKTSVFWNIDTVENPHMLIIGPTGAGKTEFLVNIAINFSILKDIPLVLFDTKGDIKERLRKKNLEFKVLNPLFHGISLLNNDRLPIQIKAMQIEKILTNSFDLSKLESSIFFKIVYDSLEEYSKGKLDQLNWDIIENKLKNQVDYSTYLLISKIIRLLRSIDFGSEISSLLMNGLNVIDLTLVKSETLRKLIIYSIILDIYNKYSSSVDNGIKIVLVLDEAWSIIKSEKNDYPIVADLIKRGRGHGIAILMATQNIEDLGNEENIYLDNVGLLVAMNNGDKNFWNNVIKRFVNIDDKEVKDFLSFLGRGEALVRFIGDPRPIIVELSRLN